MNPDVIRAIGPQVPFVVGAYGLLWAVLFGYMVWVNSRLSRTEKAVNAVDAAIARRDKAGSAKDIVAEEKAKAAKG